MQRHGIQVSSTGCFPSPLAPIHILRNCIAAWSIATILTGLLSFMTENTHSVGTVNTTDDEKRKLANKSLEYNVGDATFRRLFPEIAERYRPPEESLDATNTPTNGKNTGEVAQDGKPNTAQSSANRSSQWTPLLFKLAILAVAVYVAYIQRT
eukprot:gb/GECG01003404.1/.p1 GENE.gb/GECG01003404.1/~~gb/GECG01003404.1/.p1  ORF type:complete len:153 (+),score=6.59 gb/GECG01003404.1/:1-459(+)